MGREKKRILFIEGAAHGRYSPDPRKNMGGSSVSLFELVTGLDKEKYEASILFYYPSLAQEKLTELGCPVFLSPTRPQKTRRKKRLSAVFDEEVYAGIGYYKLFVLKMLKESLRLSKFFKRTGPDIIHCNMAFTLDLAAVIAARIAAIPCICYVRAFEKLLFIHKVCSPFVSLFICISEAIKQDYLRQGIKEEKLRLVYNGVNLQGFQVDWATSPKEGALTVTQIGRYVDWKGQDVFLKAVPLVLEKARDVQFHLVGDGPEKERLKRLSSTLQIEPYVKFSDMVPNVRPVLFRSDIVVLPSVRPEPFGRVVIEAMAAGKSVIATNMGGPKEIITPPLDGLLVEPGNPELLAEKILSLIEDEETRRKMGKAARKTVERRFNVQKTIGEIQDLYEKVTRSQ